MTDHLERHQAPSLAAMPGETPADAVRLVAATDRPVPLVASEVGDPDPGGLARVIRTAFGPTPAAVRREGGMLPPLQPPPR